MVEIVETLLIVLRFFFYSLNSFVTQPSFRLKAGKTYIILKSVAQRRRLLVTHVQA